MTYVTKRSKKPVNRRSFIKKGLGAGSATLAAGLLSSSSSGKEKDKGEGGNLSKGDAAILRFLAAAEILESDLWIQYNELGGVQDSELPELGGTGNAPYTNALA